MTDRSSELSDPGKAVDPSDADARVKSAASELVEIVDGHRSVIDLVPRWQMRASRLAHRATYVITVMAEAPIDAEINESAIEHWLRGESWPLVGSDGDSAGPVRAPRSLGPPISLASDTPVVVHRRADWKDIYPGHWDLAFGGVCDPGELWLCSARRELTEETGLASETTVFPVAAGHYRDAWHDSFGVVFVAFADRNPTPNDGEVVEVDTVPIDRLMTWTRGRLVCPDSMAMVIPTLAMLVDS